MLEKGDFTHYYHLHGNVSDNQPRSQGFSLRKWEGSGRSPGDEVVRQPFPRPANCIYLQQCGYISCQFIYVHLFIYLFILIFSAIFIFYLFISFNCLKIIIIFHVPCFGFNRWSNFLLFFCVLHLQSNASRRFRDNECLAQCCHALFIRMNTCSAIK